MKKFRKGKISKRKKLLEEKLPRKKIARGKIVKQKKLLGEKLPKRKKFPVKREAKAGDYKRKQELLEIIVRNGVRALIEEKISRLRGKKMAKKRFRVCNLCEISQRGTDASELGWPVTNQVTHTSVDVNARYATVKLKAAFSPFVSEASRAHCCV